MRKVIVLLVMVTFLLVVTSVVATQDDAVTVADNLCDAGQLWENTCYNEWMWTCGWYWAQVAQGTSGYVPWWCGTQPVVGCYNGIWYTGEANVDGNLEFYGNADCTGDYFGEDTLVIATSLDQAAAICEALFPDSMGAFLIDHPNSTIGGPNTYACNLDHHHHHHH